MSKSADIPGDSIELIAEKGMGFEDILALASVCKSWRVVGVECRETLTEQQTPELPWLMFLPRRGSHLHTIYSLSRRKICQIRPLKAIGRKSYSSRGWLLTVQSDWSMNLLHPITLARFQLPIINSSDRIYINLYNSVRFIHRVILSASPVHTSNFVLLVLQGGRSMPAYYWRFGDERWTIINTPPHAAAAFADAVFHRDKCYFLTVEGRLLVADFGTSNPTTTEFITEFSKTLIRGNFFESLYLVIVDGSLLLVSKEESKRFRREKKPHKKPYQTLNFQVFKLDFESLRWEELKSLENWSIFLGQKSSSALKASTVKGCKPNSIYFTDDTPDCSRGGAYFEMGIFNMADQTIEQIIDIEWRSKCSTPMFVDPMFF